jgi:predicted glycosyltransferase/nucleoside-diphosphate-sugar epimerase
VTGEEERPITPAGYRAVVTGAAGFIGSHLVDSLLEAGHVVVGIDAFLPYYEPAVKRSNVAAASADPRFELLPGDLNELDLEEILRPGDVVFHLAGQPGVRASWGADFPDYSRHNVDATQRVLEAARRQKVARVVFASSSSVYGDAPLPMVEDGPLQPLSPYGVTKVTAEQLCLVYERAFDLPVVPLRFFTVYGPRQRPDMAFHQFITAIHAGRPITVFGDGSQRRDFTFVEDVVAILLAAARHAVPGRPMNVGGGASVSVIEAIRLIEALVDRRAVLEHRPAPPGDARDTQASTQRLQDLGVLPEVSIGDGLARQVEWQLGRDRRRWTDPTSGPISSNGERRPFQLVLYSHDTYGLGHLRRNTAIAHALLRRSPDLQITLISGSPVAREWPLPFGVDVVALPSVVKVGPEEYRPAEHRSMSGLRAERGGIIASTLLRLRPDVFLVDHAPLGMKGELRLALQMAREELHETRVILGLRDILDDPEIVRRDWADHGVYDVLAGSYDEILVYGARELFDVIRLYQLPQSIGAKTRFSGYVGNDPSLESAIPASDVWTGTRTPGTRRILVMGGGGGDAAPLLLATIEAWESLRHLLVGEAVLVVGPLMGRPDRTAVETRAGGVKGIKVIPASKNMLSLVGAADLVVSMGGYNSVVETVAAQRPLVICPRTTPRVEQLLRAEIMQRLGLAQVARLDQGGSAAIADAMVAALRAGPTPTERWRAVDLRGAERVADILLRHGAPALRAAVA